MGYKEISLKMPTDHTDEQLKSYISKKLKIKEFSYQIEKKSLDARKRSDIFWQLTVAVSSKEIRGSDPAVTPAFNIPFKKRAEKVIIVGSGPAGFFSAFVLQKAGFNTTLIERGSDVSKRAEGIHVFEDTGIFDPVSNYAFGEGGAGTFSDGKLTSRSKRISEEKAFILSSYIKAGAPEEIGYMAHPHLGSDNLKKIVKRLRADYINIGGKVFFETMVDDISIEGQKARAVITKNDEIEADEFVFAPGHSAYETYKLLIERGVKFRTKNFAIGCRIEHRQEIINLAQWGKKNLPGVKAAEYRLTSRGDGNLPVYTFCMCPGGSIVPSSSYENTNIVNGMSMYKRDGKFANAACVAGVNLDRLTGKQLSPLEAIGRLRALEEKFFDFSNSFSAPSCTIKEFITKKSPSKVFDSSYPLGVKPADLWELLPPEISKAITEGLKDFSGKIRGFDTGTIMGLDSKSSSPIQALREDGRNCAGISNLYIAGEGSGCAGGIISSAADGIKAAMAIIGKN